MDRKPQFLSPGHFNELPLEPPFRFHGMTTSVLPLRANIRTLQRLIDRTANFAPPQVGRFRVAFPYVFLMVVDYGKLALEATNLGWFAQTEILFAVPTSHYTLHCGRWVYQGIVWFSPFIFVDSDTSLTLGRRVYGWSKLRQQLKQGDFRWLADPGGAQNLVTMETAVFKELYAGERQQMKVFCEVVYVPDRTAELIPDTRGAWFPWSMAKNAAEQFMRFGHDMMETAAGMRGMPASPEVFFATMMDAFGFLNPGNPDSTFTTINLKQFRDSGRPELYCYQALTRASMRVTSLNQAALLGDRRGFGLDASGGFRVRLHRWPMLPIVDSLGLIPERVWMGDGAQVVELNAVNPFWYNVDMLYERGRNLAERSHDGVWRTSYGRYQHCSRVRRSDIDQQRNGPRLDVPDALYNTTIGAATQTVAGPFDALDSNMQVLPLLADPVKLQRFLDEWLNQALTALGVRFELWAPVRIPPSTADSPATDTVARCAYVYLTILDWGPVRSGTDDVGDWKGEEACIFMPVRWYRSGTLMGAGLVPVVSYASNAAAMIANSEVLGWPTREATFRRPEETWIEDPSDEQRRLLCIDTEILPTLAQGQPIVAREILKIAHTTHLNPTIREQWAHAFELEVARKRHTSEALYVRKLELDQISNEKMDDARARANLLDARTLALDFLVNGAPISIYSVKQFRDVHEPQRACYQSLTRVRRSLRVKRMERLPDTLTLEITEYESNPIIELLGLERTLIRTAADSHRYLVKPVHPFWIEMSLREELGECLYYRDGVNERRDGWKPGPDAMRLGSYFVEDNIERRRLDPLVAWRIDNRAPLTQEPPRFPSERDYRTGLPFLPLVKQAVQLSELERHWPTIREVHMQVVIDWLERRLQTFALNRIVVPREDEEIRGYLSDAVFEEIVDEVGSESARDSGVIWGVLYEHACQCVPEPAQHIFKYIKAEPVRASEQPASEKLVIDAIAQLLEARGEAKLEDISVHRKVLSTKRTFYQWIRRAVIWYEDSPSRQTMKDIVSAAIEWILNSDVPDREMPPTPDSATDPVHLRLAPQSGAHSSQEDAARHAALLSLAGMSIDAVLERRLTHRTAYDAVENVDPQMILESMLTHEWGSRAEDSPRRKFLADLRQRYQQGRQGHPEPERYDIEFIHAEWAKQVEWARHGITAPPSPLRFEWWKAVKAIYTAVNRHASDAGTDSAKKLDAWLQLLEQRLSQACTLAPAYPLTDDELKKLASVPGMTAVFRQVARAFVNLVIGFDRLDYLQSRPSKQAAQAFIDAALDPNGWLVSLLAAVRGAFAAEVEQTFEILASMATHQDDFFVPESLADSSLDSLASPSAR
jgi:hypothetical protein